MTKQEYKEKSEFWINILKTVTALIIFGVVAGAANGYIQLENIQEKVGTHDVFIQRFEKQLNGKVDKREMDNLKDFLKDNFDNLNKRLDDMKNREND